MLCEDGLHCFYDSDAETSVCQKPAGEGEACPGWLDVDEDDPRAGPCVEGFVCDYDDVCTHS